MVSDNVKPWVFEGIGPSGAWMVLGRYATHREALQTAIDFGCPAGTRGTVWRVRWLVKGTKP